MNFKSKNLMPMNFKLINLKLVVLLSAVWCFFVLVKSYRIRNNNFKTGLITSFTLLLLYS